MSLRTATVADAKSLAAVIRAAFEQYRGVLSPESGALQETATGLGAELSGESDGLVAERAGDMLGGVIMKELDGDLYFGRLAVIPAARGVGLAGRLVRSVEDEAARRNLAGVQIGVRLALPANAEFFSHRGYREVSPHAHPGFDHPTWTAMRKPLDQ